MKYLLAVLLSTIISCPQGLGAMQTTSSIQMPSTHTDGALAFLKNISHTGFFAKNPFRNGLVA